MPCYTVKENRINVEFAVKNLTLMERALKAEGFQNVVRGEGVLTGYYQGSQVTIRDGQINLPASLAQGDLTTRLTRALTREGVKEAARRLGTVAEVSGPRKVLLYRRA